MYASLNEEFAPQVSSRVSRHQQIFHRMLKGSNYESEAPLDSGAHNPFINMKPHAPPQLFVPYKSAPPYVSPPSPCTKIEDLTIPEFGLHTSMESCDEMYFDYSQTETLTTPTKRRQTLMENRKWNEESSWPNNFHSPNFLSSIEGLSKLLPINPENVAINAEFSGLSSPSTPSSNKSTAQDNDLAMKQSLTAPFIYLHSTLPDNVEQFCNSLNPIPTLDISNIQDLDMAYQFPLSSYNLPTPTSEITADTIWSTGLSQGVSPVLVSESPLAGLSHHLLTPPVDSLIQSGIPSPFLLNKTILPLEDGTISPHQMNMSPVFPVISSNPHSIITVEEFMSPAPLSTPIQPHQSNHEVEVIPPSQAKNKPAKVVNFLQPPKICKKIYRPPKNGFQETDVVKKKRTIHPAIYKCEYEGCPKTFTRLYNLKSHFKIHTGEKLHTCPVCNLNFIRNHDLRRHSRLHTNERPFHCHRCDKSFARSDALKRHINVDACASRYSDDASFTLE